MKTNSRKEVSEFVHLNLSLDEIPGFPDELRADQWRVFSVRDSKSREGDRGLTLTFMHRVTTGDLVLNQEL